VKIDRMIDRVIDRAVRVETGLWAGVSVVQKRHL
jgi:hypothetical protein